MGYGYFWGHYEPTRPRLVKDGLKTKSQRGRIGETWWSKRWIGVLESFGMGARLGRGRSYARRGQVVSIDVQKGAVAARVQGTQPEPYSIKIELKPLSEKDWGKVTDAMASQAVFAARLLSGEMPQNIEEAFGEAKISLFPTSVEDLITDCSCPDWANPCKHIAAVYYLMAERFDEDPFLVFKLRGRTKEELIGILREKRSQTLPEADVTPTIEADFSQREAAVPLENCLDTFWQAGAALDSFTVNPTLPEVENAILKRLGNAPFTVGKQNVASLLAKAYSIAGATALRKAHELQEG
ncbi:MAG: SWIM zinc finger family protein [Chloroflexi bacterium]|nr:SWIM zinc finger family protein [Chloroflexota bacterium]